MQQIRARIEDMGDEALEEQLQMAVANEERRAAPDFRLTRLVSVRSRVLYVPCSMQTGRIDELPGTEVHQVLTIRL